MAVQLIYDQECPLCRAYSRAVRIRQSVGELQLINAREDSAVMRELTALGVDLDQGMVLKLDSSIYYGADAIYMLSLLSSRNNLFNKLNYYLFKSQTLSKWLYPALRFGRNTLLTLLRKRKINNLGNTDNSHF